MFMYVILSLSVVQVYCRHPLIGLNVKQLIAKEGYPVETHKVITADGYILNTIRIPHGKIKTQQKRPVVLTFSGIVCSSADWVNMGENSLGFMLADKGYDVWLGNPRGSTLSKNHLIYSPIKQPKRFWNFNLHEIGYYDIPANIDYIRNITKQEKIFYIGFSQGATAWFAMTASRPKYNAYIRLMIGLAPALYLHNTKHGFIEFLHYHMDEVDRLIELYELYEVFPHRSFLSALIELLCNDNSPLRDLCVLFLFGLGGFNPEHVNRTMIPIIASNTPGGGSYFQLKHYVQLYYSRNFQQYDYGKQGNLEMYGKEKPPIYDLKKITAPVALYYGESDALVSKTDVELSASQLPNLVFKKPLSGFNHLDMLWAVDVVPHVYNSILNLLLKY